MSPRPNVLLVSYFFPPAATGVRRVVSLVRHLPRHGWHPIVLAARSVAGSGHDAGPLADLAVREVPLVRTGSLDPYRVMRCLRPGGEPEAGGSAARPGGFSAQVMRVLRRHVFVPDDRMLWIPFAAWAGIRLVRRHRLRAVVTTNYPQSAHLVGWLIHRVTGVPWVADFRDGWTQNPAFFDPGNPVVRWLQHFLERRVARDATRLVTVSPPITRHLQHLRAHHGAPAVTIFNGFEGDLQPFDTRDTRPGVGELRLVYTGTFFGRRSPVPLLRGLRDVLRRQPEWRDRLRVDLFTELEPRHRHLIERAGLSDVVTLHAPVSHARALAEQRAADGCILVLEHGPGSEIMVSQKVFEYLSSGSPILALVPEGAAAEVLRETGGATLVTEQSPGAIAAAIERFLVQVSQGTHAVADAGVLRGFQREEQAAAFARVLDSAAP